MRALLTKIAGDLRRRRLQAVVVAVIVALATGVGTLAFELLDNSSAPYMRAFEHYHGAHLTALFDGALASSDQVQATTRLPDVTASGGPWQAGYISLEHGTAKTYVLAIERPDAGGPVDQLRFTAGRWATGPGEIVLTHSFARLNGIAIGGHVRALSGDGHPELLVVGEVADIDEGDAANFSPQYVWVAPRQLASLLPTGKHADTVVAYRFAHAATTDDLQQRSREIAAAVPPNAVRMALSYQTIRSILDVQTNVTLSFLLAFAVFALGAAALIIANVVGGTVLTSRRTIGIVKALGFTPGQVVLTFVGQMLASALVGCAVGVPLGILGSRPLVASTFDALGLPAPSGLDPLAPTLATLGGLLVVVVAAALPALRAGRLRPVEALAPVAPPGPRRTGWMSALTQRLRLPRYVSLGAGDAYARPVRGLLTTLAVATGVTTLVFAFGLHTSFRRFAENRALAGSADVTVMRFGSYPDSRLMASLNAQPETRHVVALSYNPLNVAQLSTPVNVVAMRGDSGSLGFPLVAGRWFQGPGEVVAGKPFLKEAHLAVGDVFTATLDGRPLTLRIVGEYFDFNNLGRELRFDWSTFATANSGAQPDIYQVDVRPGTDIGEYSRRIAASAPDDLSITTGAAFASGSTLGVLDTVLVVLAAILAAIAVAGVFNTLLLTSYERVRDTATLKVLGMTPGQVLGKVVTAACVLGLVGGLVGLPAGVWLNRALLDGFSGLLGQGIPAQFTTGLYGPLVLPLLALAGVAVAVLGAALPAWLTARAPAAIVLHAE